MHKFFEWLNGERKPENAEEEKLFSELKSIWDLSAKLPKPQLPDEEMDWLRLQKTIHTRVKPPIRLGFPFPISIRPSYVYAAMAVLVIIAVALYTYISVSGQVRYITERGETRIIVLEDSTIVRLQSESKFSVKRNFNKGAREVELSGAAAFDVKSAKWAFIIHSDIATVEMVGTNFNVMSRKQLFEVSVNDGLVRVSSKIANQENSVLLAAGQYTRFEKGQRPSPPQQVPFEEYPGWLHGQLAFYDVSLKFAMEEIERRFDVTIRLGETVNPETKISGLFESKDVSTVLAAICLSIQKKYEVQNGVYKIY